MRSTGLLPRLNISHWASIGRTPRQLKMSAIVCTAIILSLYNCTYSRDGLRCGDEVLISTKGCPSVEGKLIRNNGDSLTLDHCSGMPEQRKIPLSDVTAVYRIRRPPKHATLTGMLAGAALGGMLGTVLFRGGDLNEVYNRMAGVVALTVGGALIGAEIGNKSAKAPPQLHEVQLHALPTCIYPAGNSIRVKVSFAIRL